MTLDNINPLSGPFKGQKISPRFDDIVPADGTKKEPEVSFKKTTKEEKTVEELSKNLKELQAKREELVAKRDAAQTELRGLVKPEKQEELPAFNEKKAALEDSVKAFNEELGKIDKEITEINTSLRGLEGKTGVYSNMPEAREVQSRDEIRADFGKGMTRAEYKQVKADRDAAQDAVDDAEDELEEAFDGVTTDVNAGTKVRDAKAKLKEAEKDLLEKENEFIVTKTKRKLSKQGFLGINPYVGRIRTAEKNNKKYSESVATVGDKALVASKEIRDQMIKENPELSKKDFVVLDSDDLKTLAKISMYAEMKLDEAEKSGNKNALTPDQRDIYQQMADIFPILTDAEGKPVLDEGGNPIRDYAKPDMQKAQMAMRATSGFDNVMNLDEVKVASQKYYASKGDIKSLSRTLGLGVESGWKQRAKAAGIAAGSALVGNTINWLLNGTQTADVPFKRDYNGSVTYQPDPNLEIAYDSWGNIIMQNVIEQDPVDIPYSGVVSGVEKAVTKIPFAGELAGPVLAGLAAFAFTDPKTKCVSKANPEEMLQNLAVVDGWENRAIVLQMQELEITGDKERDLAIKSAVLKAGMGKDTKCANTEELLMALDAMKEVKSRMKDVTIEVIKEEPSKPPCDNDTDTDIDVDNDTDIDTDTDTDNDVPDLDIEHEPGSKEDPVMGIKIQKGRAGNWFLAHAYKNADGSEPTEAEFRQIQKALKGQVTFRDDNGDGRNNTLKDSAMLPKVVKVGDKEYRLPETEDEAIARIKKPAMGNTGKDRTYNKYEAAVVQHGDKWYVVNKKTGKRVGPAYSSRADAESARQAILDSHKSS